MGKDEKKIFRFAFYFLAMILEDHPDVAQSFLQDLERTLQSKESSVQLIGYRTLGRLCAAMGSVDGLSGTGPHSHGPRPRILQKLCSPLHEVRTISAFRDHQHNNDSANTSYMNALSSMLQLHVG